MARKRTSGGGGLKMFGIVAALLLSAFSIPQGFNVDIDSPGSPPQGGGGVPSSAFGAASGQAGFWNMITVIGDDFDTLRGLDGALTSVTGQLVGPNNGGSHFFAGNTGDYALLLNDASIIGSRDFTFTFSGLSNGWYRVYVYSAKINGEYGEADITVFGSSSANPQRVSGQMPGNRFEYLLTHSVHDIEVTSGELVIFGEGPFPNAYINGLQILPVPEPATAVSLALLGLMYLARRRYACHP